MQAREATSEEFICDLMRGHKPSFQRGYTAANAAIAAQERFGLDERETDLLNRFAEGFRDAIRRALDPSSSLTASDGWTRVQLKTYEAGLDRGRIERAPDLTLLG